MPHGSLPAFRAGRTPKTGGKTLKQPSEWRLDRFFSSSSFAKTQSEPDEQEEEVEPEPVPLEPEVAEVSGPFGSPERSEPEHQDDDVEPLEEEEVLAPEVSGRPAQRPYAFRGDRGPGWRTRTSSCEWRSSQSGRGLSVATRRTRPFEGDFNA